MHSYPHLYLIGLTGNIACGKSTVLAQLRDLGAEVIDADAVTRELQQPGQPVYQAISEAFGPAILSAPGGPINRAALGSMVFSDPEALRRLEALVHPAVRVRIEAFLAAIPLGAQRRVAVIDAIKLIESGWPDRCDALWVVVCPLEQQLERLMRTRGFSADDARLRIEAQPPQAAKAALADVVIDNGGSLDATRQQVQTAWEAIQRELRGEHLPNTQHPTPNT